MKLRYQRRALQQIDKALAYIAARSPNGAAKVEARLTAIAALIQQVLLAERPAFSVYVASF